MQRAWAAVAAGLVTATLAGCGSTGPEPAPATGVDRTTTSPEPEPTVEPEPEPEPTVRPGTIPPERPTAVDQVDKAGAETVAESFWHEAAPDPDQRLVEYRRTEACTVAGGPDGPCTPGTGQVTPPNCDHGDPIEPLWWRTRTTPTAGWRPWQLITDWSCPDPAAPALGTDNVEDSPHHTPETLHVDVRLR